MSMLINILLSFICRFNVQTYKKDKVNLNSESKQKNLLMRILLIHIYNLYMGTVLLLYIESIHGLAASENYLGTSLSHSLSKGISIIKIPS